MKTESEQANKGFAPIELKITIESIKELKMFLLLGKNRTITETIFTNEELAKQILNQNISRKELELFFGDIYDGIKDYFNLIK